MSDTDSKTYLPRPLVARRYGVTERTVARWQADPALQFPRPMEVRGRLFFAIEGLQAWERDRAVSGAPAA